LYNLPGTVWLLHFLETMYPLDVRHSCPQTGECSCIAHPYLRLMNAEIKRKCLWSSTLYRSRGVWRVIFLHSWNIAVSEIFR
jgi:hypothetical protein